MVARTITFTVTAPPTGAPAWFNAMSPNTWAQPSSNALSAVQLIPGNPGGYGNSSAQLLAYSGACTDHARKELLMVANGGHGDYCGNESYALALNVPTPYWYRLVDPTPSSFIWSTAISTNIVDGTSRYYDGRCVSMHTYSIPQYVNGKVWFAAQGHTAGGAGSWVRGICAWNRLAAGVPLSNSTSSVAHPGVADVGAWTFHGGYNDSPHTMSSGSSGDWNAGYAIADASGNVYLTNPQSSDFQYLKLNTATGAHNCYNQRILGGGNPPYGVRWANVYIGDRTMLGQTGIMAWFHKGVSNRIYLMSVPLMGASAGSAIWREITTTGTGPTINPSHFTGTGQAVYYNGAIYYMDWSLHGATIFKLPVPVDPVNGSWVWQTLTPTGSTPTDLASVWAYCHGRFSVVELATGAAVVVCAHSTTAKPWVYRL